MIQLWRLPPDEYLTLIGRVIVSMSHAETYLKQLLWKSCKLADGIGPILTGGTPIPDIQRMLRSVYDKQCENQLEIDDIASILNEHESLKKSRDAIAHRQWNNSLTGVVLSHRTLAKNAAAIEETPFTIPELENMSLRVDVLNGRLLRHLVARPAVDLIESAYVDVHRLPRATWLYESEPKHTKEERVQKARKSSPKQSLQK